MLTVKSKTHDGKEILINENTILYAIPSLDGGTVVYFNNKDFIVLFIRFDEFELLLSTPKSISDSTPILLTEEVSYPEHLPKLANGNIDKRTIQYKEWIGK